MYVSTPFLFPATCTFPNVLSRGREMAFEFTFLAYRHAYYIRTVSADLSLHAALQMSQIAPPPTLVPPPFRILNLGQDFSSSGIEKTLFSDMSFSSPST